jgi:transcriptional regulator with PAS, ATPase and Fis domain
MTASHRDSSAAADALRNHADSSAGGVTALLDVLPVGVFTLDGEQHITWLNPAGVDLLGVARDDALGRSCAELLGCRHTGPTCSACAARNTGEVRRDFPCDVHRGDGSRRSMLIDSVPLDGGDVAVLLRDVTENEALRRSTRDRWTFHGLVCVSARMKDIVDQIREVAPYDSTVLVLGESGTGKELVARALHAESARSNGPFVAVNCSAYSENLLESELFGHARGSFTGADRDRLGRFEMANGGTVFLDEVGEISPKMQVKLLRVLQEREIERVGENRARSIDVRVVAATNRDLQRAVREGRFRDDLYYRLNVYSLRLPPLRERKEDIPALADHFRERFALRAGKNVAGYCDEVMNTFLGHSWPGNVRELENVVESAVVRARGDRVLPRELPDNFRAEALPATSPEDRIRAALARAAGCVSRAARLMGVHRTTLWRQMREHGLHREDFLPE